jgi:hypothetical protein
MPNHLTITIPAAADLRREIEQGVEAYANVTCPASYADLDTIKLVLEIVGEGVEIAGGVAGIITFIRSLKKKREEAGDDTDITIGAAGTPEVPIEQANADLLARLLQTPTEE